VKRIAIATFLVSGQAALAARFIEPPMGANGDTPFIVDLINASPVLIFFLFLLLVARWQNILRFFVLWLGIACAAYVLEMPELAKAWGAFGWLVLLFLSDHWAYRPEDRGDGGARSPAKAHGNESVPSGKPPSTLVETQSEGNDCTKPRQESVEPSRSSLPETAPPVGGPVVSAEQPQEARRKAPTQAPASEVPRLSRWQMLSQPHPDEGKAIVKCPRCSAVHRFPSGEKLSVTCRICGLDFKCET